MSSSWTFKARAEPGHFNFRAETELDFFLCIAFLAQNMYFYQFLNQKISHLKKKQAHISYEAKTARDLLVAIGTFVALGTFVAI
jgi:hypothetical protein